MSLLTFFTTIEDAYYYYFQAKGASDTKDGRVIKQRHLRTAVLLGWAAVDQITHPSGLSDPILTPTAVGDALAYCKRLMKTMYPHLVVREQWLQAFK
jgi:hypothetical protein